MMVKDIFAPEFHKKCGDVDVYNDVTDDIAPAFCGGIALTEYGQKRFAKALDTEIEVKNDEDYIYIVCLLDKPEDAWEECWDNILKLFRCAAGYCSVDEYGKLFIEVEEV